jgi:hypothetical protein
LRQHQADDFLEQHARFASQQPLGRVELDEPVQLPAQQQGATHIEVAVSVTAAIAVRQHRALNGWQVLVTAAQADGLVFMPLDAPPGSEDLCSHLPAHVARYSTTPAARPVSRLMRSFKA